MTSYLRNYLCAAIVSGLACWSVEGATPDERLSPAGAFNILAGVPDNFGMKAAQVHKVVAGNGSLYFLLSLGPSADDCVVLQTDLGGGYRNATKLAQGTVRDFDVDDHGNLYVLYGYPEDHTIVYNPAGDSIDDQASPGAMKIAFIKGLGVSHVQFDGRISSGKERRYLQARFSPLLTDATAPTRFRHLVLSNRQAVMVEGVTATFQVGELLSGTTHTAQVSSPYVDR